MSECVCVCGGGGGGGGVCVVCVCVCVCACVGPFRTILVHKSFQISRIICFGKHLNIYF